MNTPPRRRIRGFSLIEVMIAVVVLSFGLLALAALQASLFRAGAETKARANATAIAQQVVENAKTFAFLSAPTGYTGNTYQGLTTEKLNNQTVGGVAYSVCRQVRRYRHDETTKKFVALNGVDGVACADTAAVGATLDPGTPEFKEVRVSVAWSGDAGQAKMVELTDSVAAISPADAIQVVKTPFATAGGPQVWIEPPNKNNPQVVPIAIGGDQSAASSNPKPEQFVQDVSAATLFSVQTFTGSTTGDEVRLNRKLDVAAVSCVCQNGTATSSTSNPAYQATQWNGKQLAYMEPQVAPAGTPIATAVVSSQSAIEGMCTVCCRDHHETASRKPRSDPYRLLTSTEASGAEHYGYKKTGSSYQVGAGLFPAGTDTGGLYVDACQLIRVNGLMRMAVDAQQNHLLVTPLDDAKTAYRNTAFNTEYSGFVLNSIKDGMASLPTAYPAPNARFPAPTSARLTAYSAIVTPPSIALPAASDTNNTRKLVAFGLYVDYLNADTIQAYNCAGKLPESDDCAGLGNRNPLEVLPLYAVNVANLGSWNSAKAAAGSVVNATYSNQGLLVQDGGIVTAGSGTSGVDASMNPLPFAITLNINNSNSGLAGTAPVDPDDKSDANFVNDAQAFTKASGVVTGSRNSLFVRVGATSTLTLSTVIVTSPDGGTQCTFAKRTNLTTCRFDSPAALLTVGFANYTTSATVRGTTVITNRKICVPSSARVSSLTFINDGQTSETARLLLNTLAAVDYTLTIDIVNQADTCPTGTAPLSP